MVEVKDAEETYFTRDGDVVEEIDRYIISNQDGRHYLEICDVESEDEGEYTVICTNQYGHVSSTAQLLITGDQCVVFVPTSWVLDLNAGHC